MAKVTITIPVGLQFTYDEKRISREEALEMIYKKKHVS